jgi:antitoxin (DNA-binding transcriptional repressor) of toxin-antitoxin stability system
MSSTVTIEEAKAHLVELIEQLGPGGEVVITRNEKPVAKIVAEHEGTRRPRRPGSAQGKLFIHAEDDEHLKDFEEYM